MIYWLLTESAGHFWWPTEFENVANKDFEHLKHLENRGHLLLTAPSMYTHVSELYILDVLIGHPKILLLISNFYFRFLYLSETCIWDYWPNSKFNQYLR